MEEMDRGLNSIFIEILPSIVCQTLLEACQPEHRSCLHEFVRLAYRCLSLINSGIIEGRIFDGEDDVSGMAAKLAENIGRRFPIIRAEFLADLCAAVVTPIPEEEFQERLAELASQAGQRSVAETLGHLARERTRRWLRGESAR
jgi:hypothetical protein